MKKSDIKTGMIIEQRDGLKYMVLLNTPHGNIYRSLTSTIWGYFDNYNENTLSNKSLPNLDIIKVYKYQGSYQYMSNIEEKNLTLIWQREEKTETQKQIEMLEQKIVEAQREVDKLKKMI